MVRRLAECGLARAQHAAPSAAVGKRADMFDEAVEPNHQRADYPSQEKGDDRSGGSVVVPSH